MDNYSNSGNSSGRGTDKGHLDARERAERQMRNRSEAEAAERRAKAAERAVREANETTAVKKGQNNNAKAQNIKNDKQKKVSAAKTTPAENTKERKQPDTVKKESAEKNTAVKKTRSTSEKNKKAVRDPAVRKEKTRPQREDGSRNGAVTDSSKIRRNGSRVMLMARGGIIALIVAALIYCFCAFFLFNVKTTEVINESHFYTTEEICSTAGIDKNTNLLRFSTKKAEARVEKELPYIADITITKKWINTLLVSVEYSKNTAAVVNGSKYVIINSSGKVVEITSGLPNEDAAILDGVSIESAEPGEQVVFAEEGALEIFTKLAGAVEKNGLDGVTAYDITDAGDVKLTLYGKMTVIIGGAVDMDEKIVFGKELINSNIGRLKNEKLIVDIRDPKMGFVRSNGKLNAIIEPETEVSQNGEEALPPGQTSPAVPEETTEEPEFG